MADFLTDNLSIYKSLTRIYSDTIHTNLTGPCKKLEDLFKNLLKDKASKYALSTDHSVYPTEYFNIKSRVKGVDSFHEKLIRKNLGLFLVNKFDLLKKENTVDAKKSEIVTEVQKFDDIIGLRIVTELKNDCAQVYELLLNSADYFQSNGIEFKDLRNQPQKMKNGLDIYRIKGIFQGLFCFELQIKSKIDEAWGDMDHSLFYKDYSVSPIKDTVQATMNNVGFLLDKIEKLLYDLRESGANFSENAEHLKFQEELEVEVAPLLLAKIELPFHLKEISAILKFMKNKAGNEADKLTELDFTHLNWPVEDLLGKRFIEIRNSDFKLIVIEGLYLNWKKASDKAFTLTLETYSSFVEEFVSYLSEYIAEEINESPAEISESISDILNYVSSPDIFLSIEKAKECERILHKANDILFDEQKTAEIKKVKNIIKIGYYRGNTLAYIQENDIDKDLTENFLSIKEAVEESKQDLDILIYKITSLCLEDYSVAP